MREAQAQQQQTQTQIMQMMAMMFAGQEQQRVTNTWVAKSMEAISASSGCAIEAAPASQEIITLPPALVRMTQSASGGAPIVDPMATESAAAEPAAAAEAPVVATNVGGGGSPLPQASKRGRGRGAGAAAATAAAIKTAASTPPRKTTKLPPGNGGGPTPEEMDGLNDDEELYFEPLVDAEEAGEDGQPNLHGTADVMKCFYANLLANKKPTKAQMTAEGERERTSSETEADAQRVEGRLLTSTPPLQDF